MTQEKIARLSGVVYLGVVLTGIFSLMYVPSALTVWDSADTTYKNILSNLSLFRLGILGSILCSLLFLLLPLCLYKLLAPVNKNIAQLMVVFAVISVPITISNNQHKLDLLTLVQGDPYLRSISSENIEALVLLHLNKYNNGLLLAQIFWGIWLLPFGWLVYKSGFLPKILGILLMIGCFSYLTNFLGEIILPNYSALGIASIIHLPASIGEIGICLWLLIMGTKKLIYNGKTNM